MPARYAALRNLDATVAGVGRVSDQRQLLTRVPILDEHRFHTGRVSLGKDRELIYEIPASEKSKEGPHQTNGDVM